MHSSRASAVVLCLLLPLLTPSRASQAPWHVAIQNQRQRQAPGRVHPCGGTIVAPSLVVTAAHCLLHFGGERLPPSELLVVAGLSLRGDEPGSHGRQARNVSQIYVPESFLGLADNFRHDIALLRLARRLDFSPLVQPADVVGTVAGGGGGEGALEVAAGLRALSNADCWRRIGESRDVGRGRRLADDELCFSDDDDGGDRGCRWFRGTSGSGFVVRGGDRNRLVGVVSRTLRPDCGRQLVVLTNVRRFGSLIQARLAEEAAQQQQQN